MGCVEFIGKDEVVYPFRMGGRRCSCGGGYGGEVGWFECWIESWCLCWISSSSVMFLFIVRVVVVIVVLGMFGCRWSGYDLEWRDGLCILRCVGVDPAGLTENVVVG